MNLNLFLEQKPLFYDVFDYARFPKIYHSIAHHFKLPKIIHIVGTNGKGTTGRFLAHMLRENHLHVGHYTSPHIVAFNERIWIDGAYVDDILLEAYHQRLLLLLSFEDAKALSYFEYTTLLAMLIFCDTCDYVVLEAGLGGEFDATNVFPKILSLITPIGYDHQAFLGESIEAIATTKLNSVKNDFILAKQYEPIVNTLAQKKADEIHQSLIDVTLFLDKEKYLKVEHYAKDKAYPSFLRDNFLTAYSALTFLGYDINLNSISFPLLEGRYQLFLPNVRLDVGHNPMAALALREAIGDKKVVLVYNSYADKEYEHILEILKPVIKRLEIIEIQSTRALNPTILHECASTLGLDVSFFKGIEATKEYVVFGSFSVVEAFLKGQRER